MIVNHRAASIPRSPPKHSIVPATMKKRPDQTRLHWQSQLILLLVIPVTSAFVLAQTAERWPFTPAPFIQAFVIGAAFAALVWILRAATPAAALTGGLFTISLYLWIPGWRTILWPLLALFLLTFAATRFGRRRKEALGSRKGSAAAPPLRSSPILESPPLPASPSAPITSGLVSTRDASPSSPPSPLSEKPPPTRFPPNSAKSSAAIPTCSPHSAACPPEPTEPSASTAHSPEQRAQPSSPPSPHSYSGSPPSNPPSLSRGHRRPLLRQPPRSHPRTPRLAQ